MAQAGGSSSPPGDVPWLPGVAAYEDAFRENVRDFLKRHARAVSLAGLPDANAYIVDLHSTAGLTKLHIYEETSKIEEPIICDQCRCMGACTVPEQQRRHLPPFGVALTAALG
jgi:hypothetical protein